MLKIEILGTGCAKCERLAATAEAAAKGMGVAYELVKIKDLGEITRRGVMFTPALVIDGEVKFSGKVPGEAEIMSIMADALSD